jgi:hypothetical protein
MLRFYSLIYKIDIGEKIDFNLMKIIDFISIIQE